MKITSFAISTAIHLFLSSDPIADSNWLYKIDSARSLFSSQSPLEREYHSCKLADLGKEFEHRRCIDLIRRYHQRIDETYEAFEEKESSMMFRKY